MAAALGEGPLATSFLLRRSAEWRGPVPRLWEAGPIPAQFTLLCEGLYTDPAAFSLKAKEGPLFPSGPR